MLDDAQESKASREHVSLERPGRLENEPMQSIRGMRVVLTEAVVDDDKQT